MLWQSVERTKNILRWRNLVANPWHVLQLHHAKLQVFFYLFNLKKKLFGNRLLALCHWVEAVSHCNTLLLGSRWRFPSPAQLILWNCSRIWQTCRRLSSVCRVSVSLKLLNHFSDTNVFRFMKSLKTFKESDTMKALKNIRKSRSNLAYKNMFIVSMGEWICMFAYCS